MPVEKSAGAVVFHREPKGKIEYLFLKHRNGRYGFAKGLIEEKETPQAAAEREIKEDSAWL